MQAILRRAPGRSVFWPTILPMVVVTLLTFAVTYFLLFRAGAAPSGPPVNYTFRNVFLVLGSATVAVLLAVIVLQAAGRLGYAYARQVPGGLQIVRGDEVGLRLQPVFTLGSTLTLDVRPFYMPSSQIITRYDWRISDGERAARFAAPFEPTEAAVMGTADELRERGYTVRVEFDAPLDPSRGRL